MDGDANGRPLKRANAPAPLAERRYRYIEDQDLEGRRREAVDARSQAALGIQIGTKVHAISNGIKRRG
ncbi:hypothetical protein [Burkholderia ubonensis]|uniref:hypothetical protein n=1 Tax=Burkholderia ubonensis TaxID=101571 RepID=UPI0018E042F7|nr:hypothetical protein [Burkholderia ubonensis]